MKTTKKIVVAVAVALVAVLLFSAVSSILASYTATQKNTSYATYQVNGNFQLKLDGLNITSSASVDWGNIAPSQTYTKSLSVVNTGNVALVASVATDPTAPLPTGFVLTWLGNGQTVAVGATVTAELTLTTPAVMTPQSFSWVMVTTVSQAS